MTVRNTNDSGVGGARCRAAVSLSLLLVLMGCVLPPALSAAPAVVAIGVGGAVASGDAEPFGQVLWLPPAMAVPDDDRVALAGSVSRLADIRGLFFAGFFDDADDALADELEVLQRLPGALAHEPASAALVLDALLLWPRLAEDPSVAGQRLAAIAELFPVGDVRDDAHPPEVHEALARARAELPGSVRVLVPGPCAVTVQGHPVEAATVPRGRLPVTARLRCPDAPDTVHPLPPSGVVALVPGIRPSDWSDEGAFLLGESASDLGVHAQARRVLEQLDLSGVWLVPAGLAGERCLVRSSDAICGTLEDLAGRSPAALLAEPCAVDICRPGAGARRGAQRAPRDEGERMSLGPSGLSVGLLVTTGVAAGLAGGLTVTELRRHDRYTSCREDPMCRADVAGAEAFEEDWRAARRNARIAWGTVGAVGVAAAASLIVDGRSRPRDSSGGVQVIPGPGAVGLGLAWRTGR